MQPANRSTTAGTWNCKSRWQRSCLAGRLRDVDALFESVVEEFGRLDILINSAAANPWFGSASELPPEAFDKASG